MSTKKTILKGTLILTISGVLSRILSFYYKIFLSDIIGLEGFGLYQMTLPVAALCMSICVGGIQITLQKHVASCSQKNDMKKAHGFLLTALILSICLVIPIALVLYFFSDFFALRLLGDIRIAPLLQIIALSLAPGCIHSCINAYFLGCSKALIPSLSMLIEQLVRVGGVYMLIKIRTDAGLEITAASGVAGMLLGEVASSLYSATIYLCKKGRQKADRRNTLNPLFSMSLPLTANRFFLHLFQSLEAVLIPTCLCLGGSTYSDALSVYGMITGMAMSLIMLPSTLINSFATMLLPAVAAAETDKNNRNISRTGQLAAVSCVYVGILCTAEFLTFGSEAGYLLFGVENLGAYIKVLAWLCPFMYLTATFSSILNGLGRTRTTFLISMSGTILRIFIILLLTPRLGIYGVLIALLIAQLITAGMSYLYINRIVLLQLNSFSLIVFPAVGAAFSASLARLLYNNLAVMVLPRLLICGCTLAGIYAVIIWAYERLNTTLQ